VQTDFRERIGEIYNAFLEGHFQFFLDEVIHDEIEFASNAPTLAFPYYGRGKGKAGLLAKWKASRVDYEFLNYTHPDKVPKPPSLRGRFLSSRSHLWMDDVGFGSLATEPFSTNPGQCPLLL
jgi:hypothetical protein